MPRPHCCRHIGQKPQCTVFKPAGIPSRQLEEIVLSLDEYEAIRLADLEGMYQEAAAVSMNISRQTFGRIIESAHRKIAEVLINGKMLRFAGGKVEVMNQRSFQCHECRHIWMIPIKVEYPKVCPSCMDEHFTQLDSDAPMNHPSGCTGGRIRNRCGQRRGHITPE